MLIKKQCPNCGSNLEVIKKVETCQYDEYWDPIEGGKGNGEHDNYNLDYYECPECGETLTIEWVEDWEIENREEKRRIQRGGSRSSSSNSLSNQIYNPNPPKQKKDTYEQSNVNELSPKKSINPHNNLQMDEIQELREESLIVCPYCGNHQITKANLINCSRCNFKIETTKNLAPYATNI